MPAGFVPKTKPFCLSRYVSRIIVKLSVSTSGASRLASETMMPRGSRSWQTTPTYSVSAV